MTVKIIGLLAVLLCAPALATTMAASLEPTGHRHGGIPSRRSPATRPPFGGTPSRACANRAFRYASTCRAEHASRSDRDEGSVHGESVDGMAEAKSFIKI
jgi:hypothetical protein